MNDGEADGSLTGGAGADTLYYDSGLDTNFTGFETLFRWWHAPPPPPPPPPASASAASASSASAPADGPVRVRRRARRR